MLYAGCMLEGEAPSEPFVILTLSLRRGRI
jgi:hypothetical protein